MSKIEGIKERLEEISAMVTDDIALNGSMVAAKLMSLELALAKEGYRDFPTPEVFKNRLTEIKKLGLSEVQFGIIIGLCTLEESIQNINIDAELVMELMLPLMMVMGGSGDALMGPMLMSGKGSEGIIKSILSLMTLSGDTDMESTMMMMLGPGGNTNSILPFIVIEKILDEVFGGRTKSFKKQKKLVINILELDTVS